MNCIACQEQLCQTLDGSDVADQAALDRHLHDCADCRAYHETTRRLRSGLRQLRPPVPPPDLSSRLVAAVLEDRRRVHRRARLRRMVSFAAAACVLVAVAAYLWPDRSTPTSLVPEKVVKQPQPEPPAPEEAKTTPRQSVESAVEAVASLTSRTTSQTVEQTMRLLPMVEPTLPELSWEPMLPTVSLREAGQGVSEGLEPVATHAKKAVGLLRRDLLPDF